MEEETENRSQEEGREKRKMDVKQKSQEKGYYREKKLIGHGQGETETGPEKHQDKMAHVLNGKDDVESIRKSDIR